MSKQFETTHWDADKVRSQGEKSAQNHRRRKNKKFNWGIYIACVVLGSVVLASLGWLLANDLCSLNKKDVTVTIEVTEGETLGQVARQLKQEGASTTSGSSSSMPTSRATKSSSTPAAMS